MKTSLIVLAVVIVAGLWFGGISVNVERPTVEAQQSLPNDVSVFQDGFVTC